MTETLFELKNAHKSYGKTVALKNINLTITRGTRLALVGESGSGKTTLLNILLGLSPLSSGSLTFLGEPLTPKIKKTLRALRRSSGVIFQDPGTSFNPLLPVADSLAEQLTARGKPWNDNAQHFAAKLLEFMQLPADSLARYPGEFSGGQRQRLAAVRALIAEPEILFADEPVSALDALAREKFLAALEAATAELSNSAKTLTQITVTHDLAIVPRIADTVAVLKNGEIVEHGTAAQVLNDPVHSYTRQLLSASKFAN